MAGTYNVNRSVTDPFYRYKMPRIVSKVEGKGNGIKTVIPNMVDIAKALGRPPTYPTKYFGCELGAQVQFDFKNERYIVNGSHESTKLQQLLDGFIRKFVLCPNCDNPETVYTVQLKKGIVVSRCKACGNSSNLDVTHRLTTFILKNPPEMPLGSQGTSLTKGKGKKGKAEKTGTKNGTSPAKKGEGEGEGEEDNQEEEEINGEDNEEPPDEFGTDEADWGEDATAEAARKRMEELSEGVKNLATCDDLELSEKDRVDKLYRFIMDKKEKGELANKGVDKEILAEGERLDIKDKVALVLAELLLTENIQVELKKHRTLFLRATCENQRAQRYLMRAFDLVISSHLDALLPKVPHILKELYDLDIVDEEVFLEWGKKTSRKTQVSKEVSQQIRDKAAPFLKWLTEAEEEGSSDEESDVEIEYDDRARVTELKAKPIEPTPNPGTAATHVGADELDIDAI